jgi:glycosyltransferase involved in cell wall biosynthesis
MPTPSSNVSIVIFHDNFAQMGGAERVAEELHRTFPGAALASTLAVTGKLSGYLQRTAIKTTWMQLLPAKARLFRWYFLLYPVAIECVNLKKHDLIVSSCFGYAKGVKRHKYALHVCYCHSPMRWVWRTSDYLEREGLSSGKQWLLRLALKPLKAWEMIAAQRPDIYIANSREVARRLKEAFGIEATVIHPPIDTSRFFISSEIGDYYLVLSRLVPYKRNDLAIKACSETGRRLKVIGAGPDMKRLQAIAGPTVEFVGRQSDEAVAKLVSHCRALILPGEEDFGMAPLEANAAGRPVVAFAGGGASETILPGINGVLFREATVESLIRALEESDTTQWCPAQIRAYSERFDSKMFRRRILAFIESVAPGLLNDSSEGDSRLYASWLS